MKKKELIITKDNYKEYLGEAIVHIAIIPTVIEKLKISNFKEENPTINTKIEPHKIEKALNEVTPHFSKSSIDTCEKYYKAEEIKEEILKEREYKAIEKDFSLTKEELIIIREKLKNKLDNLDTQIPGVSKTKKLIKF